MRRRNSWLGIAAVLAWPVLPTFAEEQASRKDRAAITACLKRADATKKPHETCIGAVQGPCLETPDGGSTAGMKECAGREILVWNERLNAAYRAVLKSDIGTQKALRDDARRNLTGADILRDAQRAWIAFRDKKCDAAALPMEGGTGAGLLSTDCALQETARQALWLETFAAY